MLYLHTFPLFRVRSILTALWAGKRQRDELKNVFPLLPSFLNEQPTAITEYDEQLVRRLIEKITIFKNKFTV